MSRLVAFRQMERFVEAQVLKLESWRISPALQRDISFEAELLALLDEYGFGMRQVLDVLRPVTIPCSEFRQRRIKATRRPRAFKVYINPHDGTVAETKMANHGLLKRWKKAYGSHVVESWRVS